MQFSTGLQLALAALRSHTPILNSQMAQSALQGMRLAQALAPSSRRNLLTPRAQHTQAQGGGAEQQPAKSDQVQVSRSGEQQQQRAVTTPRRGGRGALSRARSADDIFGFPVPFRRMADHMVDMQREMNSLMGAFGLPDPLDLLTEVAAAPTTLAPVLGDFGRLLTLEIDQDDKAYTIKAEVPGFSKDEIKITVSPHRVLTITGEHREQLKMQRDVAAATTTAQQGGDRATSESGGERATADGGGEEGGGMQVKLFQRSIQLPPDADVDAVQEAVVKNGLLMVTVPKAKQPKHKEIPVKA